LALIILFLCFFLCPERLTSIFFGTLWEILFWSNFWQWESKFFALRS